MHQEKKYIGLNIRFLREEKAGVTQEQFVEKMGMKSTKTLSRYENEEQTPPLDLLIKLSNHFHCAIDDLVYKDLSKDQTDNSDWKLGRKPKVSSGDFTFFEGQKYFVYYLSEKSGGKYKTGELELDEHHDEKRLYLHGTLQMHHLYDCKLVIDGRNVIIYATGVDRRLRAVIVLHFPDFGENKEFKYRGGLGIVTHRDTHHNQSAQRICLIDKEIKTEEDKKELLRVLTGDDGIERITIKLEMDSIFSQWILNREGE